MSIRAKGSSLSLHLPCGNSSTCTSCKRRWRVGGLWAVDDQAAWRGQHPVEAPGSYGPVPAWVKRANKMYSLIRTSPRLCMLNVCWKKNCTKMQPWVIEDAISMIAKWVEFHGWCLWLTQENTAQRLINSDTFSFWKPCGTGGNAAWSGVRQGDICTDQASALATEAGVLQPSPHVFVGVDD